jgi:hypothetical protein
MAAGSFATLEDSLAGLAGKVVKGKRYVGLGIEAYVYAQLVGKGVGCVAYGVGFNQGVGS